MLRKLHFTSMCMLIFMAGGVFYVNIAPYLDNAHYERHWSKAAVAAALAILFSVINWQKDRE